MNPVVARVHAQEKRWNAAYVALRKLCLASGLNEELKWGQACYDLDGKNIVLIHGFKDYCALMFMKGVLMKDEAGLLIQQTENVQDRRQLRFVSLAEIEARSNIISAYIAEAIAIEKSGAQVPMKTVAQFAVPQELQDKLDAEPDFAKAFRALTPGRQKGYFLHIGAAKQSATRLARIEKHAPRIMMGLGVDD